MDDPKEPESLSESFHQSRREFRFMIVAWSCFAAWTLTYVSRKGDGQPGESLHLVWGMPEWVVFGILIPWGLGLALTVWFALRFMKDTDLEVTEKDSSGEGESR